MFYSQNCAHLLILAWTPNPIPLYHMSLKKGWDATCHWSWRVEHPTSSFCISTHYKKVITISMSLMIITCVIALKGLSSIRFFMNHEAAWTTTKRNDLSLTKSFNRDVGTSGIEGLTFPSWDWLSPCFNCLKVQTLYKTILIFSFLHSSW